MAGVHKLLPGVTGWAQINGRDNNDDHEKTQHDRDYLNNKSLWLDIKIIFRTVFKVLRAEGILDGVSKQTSHAGKESSSNDVSA